MSDVLRGGCLCGAVSYEAKAAPMVVGHCHCDDCRKIKIIKSPMMGEKLSPKMPK